MKKIEAIIQKSKLEDVKKFLQKNDIFGMTVYDVCGFGHQKGHKEFYRGVELEVEFVEKVKLEIIADDNEIERIVDFIIEKTHTGKVGDGKIFISPIEDVIRIRTGERKKDAL